MGLPARRCRLRRRLASGVLAAALLIGTSVAGPATAAAAPAPSDCAYAATASRLLASLQEAGNPQEAAGIRAKLLDLGFGPDGTPPARCAGSGGGGEDPSRGGGQSGDEPLQGVSEKKIFVPSASNRPVISVSAGEDIGAANPGPGDVVEIATGTYKPFTAKNGSENAWVTYRAAPDAEVIIKGSDGDSILKLENASWVHLSGITVRQGSGFAMEILESDHIALTDCGVDTSQDGGIRAADSSYLHIQGCEVRRTNQEGTSADSEALSLERVSNFEVFNNRVYDNGEEGIDIKYGSDDGSVHHNAAWNNRGPNIYIDGASNVDVHHNWAWGATNETKSGIMLSAESQYAEKISNVTVRDNVIWGNAGDGINFYDDESTFEGIKVTGNVLGDGDSPPDGAPAGVELGDNVTGAIPAGIDAITGSTGSATADDSAADGRAGGESGDEGN